MCEKWCSGRTRLYEIATSGAGGTGSSYAPTVPPNPRRIRHAARILAAGVLAGTIALSGTATARAEELVDIPDPGLRACIALHLHADAEASFTASQLAGLTSLNCGYSSLPAANDLTGVESLTSLDVLYLKPGAISDLHPLQGLTRLTLLHLSGNRVTDLGPLAGLTKLERLRLADNPITTTAPLEGLPSLQHLEVQGTDLAHPEDLAKLAGLKSLAIGNTSATDYRALSRLSLEALSVSDSQVATLDGVGIPVTLRAITLDTPRLKNLAGLEVAAGLTNIYAAGPSSGPNGALSDISALAPLNHLAKAYLARNSLHDISALADKPELETLYAEANAITDIAALSSASDLADLQLSRNDIRDLGPLAGLRHLVRLEVSQNPVGSLAPIAGLPLTSLAASGTGASDVGPLRGMTSLRSLSLESNGISDISDLAVLSGLASIDVRDNRIADISSLGSSTARLLAGFQKVAASQDARIGVAAPLGLRGRDGESVCASTSHPGVTCDAGLVTYPEPGTYQLTFAVPSSQNTEFSGTVTQHAGPDHAFTRTYAPTMTHAPMVGIGVNARVSGWTPAVPSGQYSYEWYIDGTLVARDHPEQPDWYTPSAADRKHQLSVCVVAHLDGYEAKRRCSAAVTVLTGYIRDHPRPRINGTAITDSVLTADPQTWDDAVVFSYQWQRNGRSIPGRTASTYTVQPGDVGDDLRVRVTGTKPGCGRVTTYSTSVRVRKALLLPVVPTVTGQAAVSHTLTAEAGAWGPTPVTLAFQWFRGSSAIRRATAPTYSPTTSDLGKTIRVLVTATRPGYYTSRRTSLPTEPVTRP